MPRKSNLITRITEFFEKIGRRRLYIQTHDVPDPDAIASAEAFRLIARHFGKSGRIVTNGLPNRRENNALIRECKIHIRLLDDIRVRSADTTAWAFVDCLPGSGNVTLHPLAPGDCFIALDHHNKPRRELLDNPDALHHIDRGVGATATMLTKALFEFDVSFPPRLASALSYAIITDTQDFSRGASELDLQIYSRLFPLTNQRIISRLRNVTKPREYFRRIHTALENAFFYRHVAWVYMGPVAGGETVAETADFILSCERITWTLAIGYRDDRLFLSMRSSQQKARCDRVIVKATQPHTGAVGGHSEMAGGFVRVLDDESPEELADDIIIRFIRAALRLKKTAEDPEGTLLIEE